MSENIVESFWTEYAALALGARVVFAYPDLTAQELLYILDHSEAKMLLAEDQEQVDKFLAIKSDLLRIARVIYVDPRGLWNYCEPLLRGWSGRAVDLKDGNYVFSKADNAEMAYLIEKHFAEIVGTDVAIVNAAGDSLYVYAYRKIWHTVSSDQLPLSS